VKTGKIRYIVADFPLESIHPQAFKAAEASRCAGDQGKYWEMHALLFTDPRALNGNDLVNHARSLGLPVGQFEACLNSSKHGPRVRNDLTEGQKAGVRGTPTFLLGVAEGNGMLRALRLLRGAQPFSAFKTAIDAALTQK